METLSLADIRREQGFHDDRIRKKRSEIRTKLERGEISRHEYATEIKELRRSIESSLPPENTSENTNTDLHAPLLGSEHKNIYSTFNDNNTSIMGNNNNNTDNNNINDVDENNVTQIMSSAVVPSSSVYNNTFTQSQTITETNQTDFQIDSLNPRDSPIDEYEDEEKQSEVDLSPDFSQVAGKNIVQIDQYEMANSERTQPDSTTIEFKNDPHFYSYQSMPHYPPPFNGAFAMALVPPNDLPNDWREAVDPYNRIYYISLAERKTTWEKPDVPGYFCCCCCTI